MYSSLAKGLPLNDIATGCSHTGKPVHGDVASVRSGPDGDTSYEEEFARMDLVRTANWYNSANSKQVFNQRGKKGRRQGFPPGFLDGMPTMHIS
jgi:hypothetical protein